MVLIVFLKTSEDEANFNKWFKEVFVGISDLLRIDISYSVEQIQESVAMIQRGHTGKFPKLQVQATLLALESILRCITEQQLPHEYEN